MEGGGGSGAGADEGGSGGDFGRAAPSERKPAMAGAGGGKRDDMDDEIPF